MSNDSSPTQPERTEPTLPQFDPTSTSAPVPPPAPAVTGTTTDETQVLPSTPTARTPIVPPAAPYTYAAVPAAPAEAAPPGAQRSTRWSGKKSAITAGLALVLTSAGAIGAAVALPSGSTAETGRFGGPGQGRTFQFPGGQGLPGQQGQQGQGQQVLPNQPGQQGGGQLPVLPDPRSDSDSDADSGSGGITGLDPNQLLQMSPDELLQMLDDQAQLGSGGSGQTDPFAQDDSGQRDSDQGGTASTT